MTESRLDGTRRDGDGISVVQDVQPWKAVRVFTRAHRAVFGIVPDRQGRRLVYAIFAALSIVGWYGFVIGYPMLSGKITPIIWALAAGLSVVAVVKVDSRSMWALSGTATLAATTWRAVSILYFELGFAPERGPHVAAGLTTVAVVAWLMASIGIVAVWGSWLRPDQ